MEDCAGDEGASDDRMLASVLLLSRLLVQPGENSDDPNALARGGTRRCCGIEPALRRDKRADLESAAGVALRKPDVSVGVWEPGLKGLVEGVGRDVFGISDD